MKYVGTIGSLDSDASRTILIASSKDSAELESLIDPDQVESITGEQSGLSSILEPPKLKFRLDDLKQPKPKSRSMESFIARLSAPVESKKKTAKKKKKQNPPKLLGSPRQRKSQKLNTEWRRRGSTGKP